jgi:hypothetical protein
VFLDCRIAPCDIAEPPASRGIIDFAKSGKTCYAIPDSSSHSLLSIQCPCKQGYLLVFGKCAKIPKKIDVLKEPYF